jgi:hypothetical protein
MDPPFILLLSIHQLKNLALPGANPEVFALRRMPLRLDLLDLQALPLPAQGDRALSVCIPRVALD